MDNSQSLSYQGEGSASSANDVQSEQPLVLYTPSGQDAPSTSSNDSDDIMSSESIMGMYDGATVVSDERRESEETPLQNKIAAMFERIFGEESAPVEACGQRIVGTPKRKAKAAVNSPRSKAAKAPRISRSSGGGDDTPYWLKEMTKFMTGAKAQKLKPKQFDISEILEESILGPPSGTMHNGVDYYAPLPKKFRFEEDNAMPLTEEQQREAEWAKDLDGLFEELNFNCAAEESQSVSTFFDIQTIDQN
ncbi:uncharacterized protein LOC127256057 [Andrographis paniculata]|uniref:uncharacterized protein LOC127256057 n=1 Tax=Andrographis paniculata TaxID=175694 RepID=UPI0021E87D72|nr:uncharacterized protein LOC127256057 [Andrographis paniculata]